VIEHHGGMSTDASGVERISEEQELELLRVARAAALRAYSPYSKIRVGAALLGADGKVYAGCNVENASYGLTLCAERAAVVQAIAGGTQRFRAIAVTTNQKDALMPCGACRQVLHEFAPELCVIVQGDGGPRVRARLSELLPRAFGPGDLSS
jgi:cytidine deaminase